MFGNLMHGLAVLISSGLIVLFGWSIYKGTITSMSINDEIVVEQQEWQQLTGRYRSLVAQRQMAELLERHANLLMSGDTPIRKETSPGGKPLVMGSSPGLTQPVAEGLYCDAWIMMGIAAGKSEGLFLGSDREACTAAELAERQERGATKFWKTEIANMRGNSDAEIAAVLYQAGESLSKLETLRKRFNLWGLNGMFVAIFILFHSAFLSVNAIATSSREVA